MDFVTDLHYKTHLYRSETSNAGQGTIYFFKSYHITLVFEERSARTCSAGRVIDSVRVFCFVRSMNHTLRGVRRGGMEKRVKKKR